MWGYLKWERCELCGLSTFDIAAHVCDNTTIVNQEVHKLSAEFIQVTGQRYPVTSGDWRRFCWKPFDDWFAKWIESREGQFERYYWSRRA